MDYLIRKKMRELMQWWNDTSRSRKSAIIVGALIVLVWIFNI
jgi:uncharacterized protein HemY